MGFSIDFPIFIPIAISIGFAIWISIGEALFSGREGLENPEALILNVYADAADSDPSPRGRPNSTSTRTVS